MSERLQKATAVCVHWRAGRCTRFHCPFLHRELQAPPLQAQQHNNGIMAASTKPQNPNINNTWRSNAGGGGVVRKTEEVVCKYWVKGNNYCRKGNSCRFLHSWTTGNCFSLLKQLEGHQKVVTGIALPASEGSDHELYSASMDKTIRSWDCQSGQSAGVFNIDGEVGCMLSEGPWLFVGLTNLVKAKNTQTGTPVSLNGPVSGQVYALALSLNNILFAGTENGNILAWRYNGSDFEQAAAAELKGHTHRVVSLIVGAGNRLYSGSMDKSIRVWSLETMQCLHILTDHTSAVMSVLCWNNFLLSCSLDRTIKIWAANESGKLEVIYTHQEEHALLALFGMHDSEAKPVLMCSCNDNTIRVYDLPSFSERGKIFSKERVRRIEMGPAGLFFTGDESGQVRVWKWLTDQSSSTSTAN